MIHRTDSDVTLQPIDKGLLIIQLVTIPDMKGSRTPNDRPWFFFANARLAAIFGVAWAPGTWMGPIVQGVCSHNPSFVPSNSIEFRLRHTRTDFEQAHHEWLFTLGKLSNMSSKSAYNPTPILYIIYYILLYIILYIYIIPCIHIVPCIPYSDSRNE